MRLVVTDVDNTLFDWVGIWAGAFTMMIDTLAHETGRRADHWLEAARRIHVRRGATECPTLLADFALSAGVWPRDASHRPLVSAATAYRRYWADHLVPYPGVRKTLGWLTENGCEVIAYTESDAAVAAARLKQLGLAGVVRRVFGRAPAAAMPDSELTLIDRPPDSGITIHFIPQQDGKPNPRGLRRVLELANVKRDDVIYMGDNLWKDVAMAERARVRAVWARYGTRRVPEHTRLLERVAHWADMDLSDERRATVDTVHPKATLDHVCQLRDLLLCDARLDN